MANFAFLSKFEQNIGLEHISSTKIVNDFIKNVNFFNFNFNSFLNFFFLTDVSNYCEERKIKLFINVYITITRNLGGNF